MTIDQERTLVIKGKLDKCLDTVLEEIDGLDLNERFEFFRYMVYAMSESMKITIDQAIEHSRGGLDG